MKIKLCLRNYLRLEFSMNFVCYLKMCCIFQLEFEYLTENVVLLIF